MTTRRPQIAKPEGDAAGESAWRSALLDRLASGPDRVEFAARRAGDPGPDEWTATQIVGHLVAVEELVWHARLGQLGVTSGSPGRQLSPPTWSWLEPGPWTGAGHDTLDGAVAELRRRRNRTLAMVGTLEADGWTRFGIHATYGRLDVARLLAIAVDHDAEHLAQIEALIPG